MFMPSGTTGDVAARNGQERRAWQRDRSVEIVLPVRVIPVILLSHCLQSDVDFSFSLGTNKALRVNISVIKKSEVLFISSRLHSVSRQRIAHIDRNHGSCVRESDVRPLV